MSKQQEVKRSITLSSATTLARFPAAAAIPNGLSPYRLTGFVVAVVATVVRRRAADLVFELNAATSKTISD